MSNDLVGGAVPSCSAFAEVAGDLGGAGCAGGAGGEGGEVSFMTLQPFQCDAWFPRLSYVADPPAGSWQGPR